MIKSSVTDAIEALRQVESTLGELELLKVTTAAKRVGARLCISPGTARKRLDEALTTGHVVVPGFSQMSRHILLPGGADLPQLWVLGSKFQEDRGYRLVRQKPTEWGLGGVTFLLTASRCAELVANVKAQVEAERAKRDTEAAALAAEADAEQREKDALFDQHFPSLGEALDHLGRAGTDDLEIWKSVFLTDGRAPRGRLTISLNSKNFPLLERVLRKGLDLGDWNPEGEE